MSLEVNHSDKLVNILKCHNCKRFLSVLPIYLTAEGAYICGRCKDLITDSSLKKDTVYETLAQYLIFPCSNHNEGCTVQLKINKVENHENVCLFQMIKCPMHGMVENKQCLWMSIRKNLQAHMQIIHSINCHNNPVQIVLVLKESHFVSIPVCINYEIFIAELHYDKATEMIYCTVRGFGFTPNPNEYTYALHIFDNQSCKSQFSFQNSMKERWIRQHQDIDKDNSINMNLGSLLKTVNSVKITIDINVVKSESLDEIVNKEMEHEEYVDNVLEDFLCVKCNNYVEPIIYTCGNNHIMCYSCIEHICSMCNSPEIIERPTNLLNKLRSFKFPCTYSSFGCEYIGNSIALSFHHKLCIYQRECIIKSFLDISCDFDGRISNSIRHIEEHHNSYFHDKSITTETIDLQSDTVRYIFVTFNKMLFLFCYKKFGPVIIFNVLNLDINEKERYHYQLKFIDKSESGQEFLVYRKCKTDCETKHDVFRNNNYCTILPLSMLKAFLGPRTSNLHFECTIYQEIVEE